MALIVKRYTEDKALLWDQFVLGESMNGTFLQTRKFINYHAPEKFADCSLMFYKGESLVAVILSCEAEMNGKKIFFSHKGTTFGGIIISNRIYSSSLIMELMDVFEEELLRDGYAGCYLKMTPAIFQKSNTDLLDYFLYQRGFLQYSELNFYMLLEPYRYDISSCFSSGKRRDYKYSLKNNLKFRELESKDEVRQFYDVLQLNLNKLGLRSVHSYEDLVQLKFERFSKEIIFYGVYLGDKLIAGSMIFIFFEEIFHTQYLSSDQAYLKYFPMDFLIYHLIEQALAKGMRKFTFGICTENQGRELNMGLARFKEGFGAGYALNKSFEKSFEAFSNPEL